MEEGEHAMSMLETAGTSNYMGGRGGAWPQQLVLGGA